MSAAAQLATDQQILLPEENLASLRARAAGLHSRSIDFIPNAEFSESSQESGCNAAIDDILRSAESSVSPADLPAHLRRLCEVELLTHEQESALFREMNLLKFRAHTLRSRLDLEQPDAELVGAIEAALKRSKRVRDHLVKANMRLVMSIVKKFVTPLRSFDDMLSDGTYILMQAVDKFDFDRGFRFSTYAYRAIARNAYRSVTSAHKEEARFTRDAEGWAFEQEDDRSSSPVKDRVWNNLSNLTAGMLKRLDRRERFIIRCRYALGSHRKPRTFQFLADKLRISKERTRQLEMRAVKKLQEMAAEFDKDELFTAAMV